MGRVGDGGETGEDGDEDDVEKGASASDESSSGVEDERCAELLGGMSRLVVLMVIGVPVFFRPGMDGRRASLSVTGR